MKSEDGTPVNCNIDIEQIENLIGLCRYEEVAEILEREQVRQSSAGNELPAELFGIARLICTACSQSHAEKDWHKRAGAIADSRECDMKSQLQSLLDLIAGGKITSAGPDDTGDGPIFRAAQATRQGQGMLKLLHDLMSRMHPPARTTAEADLTLNTPATERWSDGERPSDLTIFCLGRFRVFAGDRQIGNWHSLKGKSVFKYLIANHKSPIPKEVLMEIFWPDSDPDSARRNLHQAIYNIRQTFQLDRIELRPIVFENDQYGINPKLAVRVDCDDFESHADRGRQMESLNRREEAIIEYRLAEELFQGDFLEEDPYEEWPARRRDQLRNDYLFIADRLATWHQERGDYEPAIEYCRKIIDRDDCFETAHRRIMECHRALGQSGLAVRQYQLCTSRLRDQLGVSPSRETKSLYESIVRSDSGFGLAMKSSG